MADNLDGAWNTTRIEALSDGVFAIVMTLLVLEIKVPDLPRDAAAADLWHALREHWPSFFSFFFTFAFSAVYWGWHHAAFHQIRTADTRVLVINLGFLMFVSLLPFSTAMLGAFTLRQPVSLGIYFGNLLAIGLMFLTLWTYATRRGFVTDPSGPIARRLSREFLLQPIACAATLAVLPFAPRQAFRVFGLIAVVGAVILRRQLDAVRRP
jgi:uncharacterized membrane protein